MEYLTYQQRMSRQLWLEHWAVLWKRMCFGENLASSSFRVFSTQ